MEENKEEYNESGWNLAKATEYRYNELLKLKDRIALDVEMGNYKQLRALYGVFKILWYEWRPRFLSSKKRKDIDNQLEEIKTLLGKYLKGINTKSEFSKLITDIDSFHQMLMEEKEKIGFGMPDKVIEDEEVETEKDGAYIDL